MKVQTLSWFNKRCNCKIVTFLRTGKRDGTNKHICQHQETEYEVRQGNTWVQRGKDIINNEPRRLNSIPRLVQLHPLLHRTRSRESHVCMQLGLKAKSEGQKHRGPFCYLSILWVKPPWFPSPSQGSPHLLSFSLNVKRARGLILCKKIQQK